MSETEVIKWLLEKARQGYVPPEAYGIRFSDKTIINQAIGIANMVNRKAQSAKE
jgi:hypothetical protein